MQKTAADLKRRGRKVGFVPTMGALHTGHMSLVEQSKKQNDITVVSIFVNPTQFGQNDDLAKYPRPFAKDKVLLEKADVDYLFYPTAEQIYPDGFKTYVSVRGLSEILEGKTRPGHFDGVATVVLKLFEITKPTNVYFGQKDFQQCAVVKKMISDLNLPVNFNMCPIVRENSGLAMSSRNVYLDEQDREQALGLSTALMKAKALDDSGEKNVNKILSAVKHVIDGYPRVKVDYITIRKASDLSEIKKIDGPAVVLIAAYVGKTRLIDNLLLGYN